MPINRAGLELIMEFEGCELKAYADAGRGVLTVGYGHTGPDVYDGLVINDAQAVALLTQDVRKFERGVAGALAPRGVLSRTTANEFAAMVVLAFNIGVQNFQISSVLRHHAAGNRRAAADAFLLWNKAGGRVLPGLVRRRHRERELYLA